MLSATLTIWDSGEEPPAHDGPVYRWNGYAETDRIHSLLRYVEQHGERLRRKYLTWIHDLGEHRIGDLRLIDHLAFEDGLSYWWMTLLVEQSPWKSPAITDAIRLFAVEEIVAERNPGKLRLVSASRKLHETLVDLCRTMNVPYEWEPLAQRRTQRLGLREIFRSMPHQLQALFGLARYLFIRWPFRQLKTAGWFSGDRALFFCSYFFHLDARQAKQGRFHSHYWEGLHELMTRLGLCGNWLQLYYPHAAVARPQTGIDWVHGFNRQCPTQGFHTFLDAYLDSRIVFRVLKRWLWLSSTCRRLAPVEQAFRPAGSGFSLWPLMREDWLASLRGFNAIDNLLWIELFDAALRSVPHQGRGLYLCENQAWERALIHAWRKHGHGRLIAVPHSTVRFWHLSYFRDPRTLHSAAAHPLPQPDVTALNGKAAVDAYTEAGYPAAAIAECEALRYGYLHDFLSAPPRETNNKDSLRVLVLGDYFPALTNRMLGMLDAAMPRMTTAASYTVKPHPNFPVDPKDHPALGLQIVTEPLAKILRHYDVVCSSNMTSAAVDAYLAGLPVVVVLDDTELNFSPLRGQVGVRFVGTPEEMAKALQDAGGETTTNAGRNEFFLLDPELPRWRQLLE